MLRRILKERHGINGGESFHIGKYEACLEKDRLYLLVPAGGLEDEYIRELEQLAAHYKKCGDNHVCQFLKTGGGETVIPWGGSRYCTLVVHIRKDRVRTVKQLSGNWQSFITGVGWCLSVEKLCKSAAGNHLGNKAGADGKILE